MDEVGLALRGTNQNGKSFMLTNHLSGGKSNCDEYYSFANPADTARKWMTFYLFQSGHGGGANPDLTGACAPLSTNIDVNNALMRARVMPSTLTGYTPAMPAANGEGPYDATNYTGPVNHPNVDTRYRVRQTGYLSMLSNAFGFTYGAYGVTDWTAPNSFFTVGSSKDMSILKANFLRRKRASAGARSAAGRASRGAEATPGPGPAWPRIGRATLAAPGCFRRIVGGSRAGGRSRWRRGPSRSRKGIAMDFSVARIAAVLLLGLCAVVPSVAQSPAGGELLLNPSYLPEDQYPNDVACDRGAACMITWDFGVFTSEHQYLSSKYCATTVSPAGSLIMEKVLAGNDVYSYPQTVASGRRFAYFWLELSDEAFLPLYQWLDEALVARSPVISLPVLAEGSGTVRDIQPVPGGFVQLESGYDQAEPASDGAFLGFVDFNGHRLRPTLNVNESPEDHQRPWRGGLAVDVPSGIITVAYEQVKRGELETSDVYFRRFSLTGEPLTPAVRANTCLPDWQTYPSVAAQPGGAFVMVWTSLGGQDGSYAGIFGQRFTKEGVAVGPEFPVNQVTFSDQNRALVATDAAGNFVVIWSSYDPSQFGLYDWDVKGRLYRADGTPVGPEIYINRHRELSQDIPSIAFAPNGTFFVAWSGITQIAPEYINGHDIFSRRFSASPADEPCIVGGGRFLCDTGRTGGDPEVRHPFGGGGSGFGFLGDVDGDGREDPCVYTGGGVFRCDTDHEGGAAEVQIAFSIPGSPVPLLGDVDGDGRADPCLAVAGRFSCDTRHDGGSAELTIGFGAAGETLLLADLDGDGRAEACVYTPGQFRCDTGHNGGSAETVIRFGRRGDQVLLGDFDGDGRDDPCVFRKGTLLCDTAHDGGAAEATLQFAKAGDRLVLGNLDGL